MGKIIAVANQKGGVGKTTTCTSLCCALRNRGRRVLLCDADPQGNSTSGMGVEKTASPTIYDILINDESAEKCVVTTKYGDVIPSNKDLSGATVELVGAKKREFVLKTGCLWRYVRASMSVIGITPPVVDRGVSDHLLVDGGYVNNVPTGVMKQVREGNGVDCSCLIRACCSRRPCRSSIRL